MAKNEAHAKQGLTRSPAMGFTSLNCREHPTRTANVAKQTSNPTHGAAIRNTIGSQAKLKPS
jgi:hypothetical protein